MDIRPISNMAQSPPSVGGNGAAASSGTPFVAKTVAAPVQTVAAVQQPPAVPGLAEVTQAVKDINKAMDNLSSGLEFSVDNDSRRTIIRVVDQKTKEIIRQIPTEDVLQIAKALDHAQGLLISQKA